MMLSGLILVAVEWEITVRVREFFYVFEQKFLYLHSLKLATCSLYKWTAPASFQ